MEQRRHTLDWRQIMMRWMWPTRLASSRMILIVQLCDPLNLEAWPGFCRALGSSSLHHFSSSLRKIPVLNASCIVKCIFSVHLEPEMSFTSMMVALCFMGLYIGFETDRQLWGAREWPHPWQGFFFLAPWDQIAPKIISSRQKESLFKNFLDENAQCQLLVIENWMMKRE